MLGLQGTRGGGAAVGGACPRRQAGWWALAWRATAAEANYGLRSCNITISPSWPKRGPPGPRPSSAAGTCCCVCLSVAGNGVRSGTTANSAGSAACTMRCMAALHAAGRPPRYAANAKPCLLHQPMPPISPSAAPGWTFGARQHTGWVSRAWVGLRAAASRRATWRHHHPCHQTCCLGHRAGPACMVGSSQGSVAGEERAGGLPATHWHH